MAALLCADVNIKSQKLKAMSPARPENRGNHGVINPLEIFRTRQIHGGMYRCPYESESIGVLSIIVRFLGGPSLFAPLVYALYFLVCTVLIVFNKDILVDMLG